MRTVMHGGPSREINNTLIRMREGCTDLAMAAPGDVIDQRAKTSEIGLRGGPPRPHRSCATAILVRVAAEVAGDRHAWRRNTGTPSECMVATEIEGWAEEEEEEGGGGRGG